MGERDNQTLRDCLFHTDITTRNKARNTFRKHIDNVLSASYGPDLCITYRCIDENQNEKLKTDIVDNLFIEKEPCYFWRARHKDLCNKVKGGIMYCGECDKNITTVDIVNQSLQRLSNAIISGNRAQLNTSQEYSTFTWQVRHGRIHFLVPHEWMLRIRNRFFLGKNPCSKNIIEV